MSHTLSLKDSLSQLRDKRFFTIFILGFSSGFPWVLHGTVLTLWMQESGLSRSTIGYLGAVATIYAINWMWSPFIDKFRIPYLFEKFGQRRSWILLTQAVIVLAVLLLSLTDPAKNLWPVGILALVISLASATQDIVEGAYRIMLFSAEEADKKIPFAAAITTAGWLSGYGFIGGTFALWLGGETVGLSWSSVYQALACLYVGIMGLIVLSPEPIATETLEAEKLDADSGKDAITPPKSRVSLWLQTNLLAPFGEFFQRCGVKLAVTILVFLFSFRLGEAMLGRMSLIFYVELGFSIDQIALYEKFFGGFMTIVFSVLAAFINVRYGAIKGMMIGGIAMASSNLLYALMAQVGPDPGLFMLTLAIDNFTLVFSTVAVVSFISHFASRTFTGTQFALMTSISNFGKTTLAASSGLLVDQLGGNWSLFFIITTVLVIPALILLVWLGRQLKSKALEEKNYSLK